MKGKFQLKKATENFTTDDVFIISDLKAWYIEMYCEEKDAMMGIPYDDFEKAFKHYEEKKTRKAAK